MIFAADIPSAVSREECERLAELAEGKLVLEIGSEYGRSTIALASTARVVHAVDWHKGDQASGLKDSLTGFLGNLQRYEVRNKVIIHLGRSEDILPILRPAIFDVVFIDGDHSVEAATRDAEFAATLTCSGGAIVFHDADQSQVLAVARGLSVGLGVALNLSGKHTLADIRMP